MVYAGIGSRGTPPEILSVIGEIAFRLDLVGWTVRSGCAPGADTAFEKAANKTELYLPWPKFEGRTADMVRLERPQREAYPIAAKHHPAWSRLSPGARSLHARNVHQILGPDVLNPIMTQFVICWTPDGKGGGGTGQAIRIAKFYEIPIFDLGSDDGYDRVMNFLNHWSLRGEDERKFAC